MRNVPQWTANIGTEYCFATTGIGSPQGDIVTTGKYQLVGTRQADFADHFSLGFYYFGKTRLPWEARRSMLGRKLACRVNPQVLRGCIICFGLLLVWHYA